MSVDQRINAMISESCDSSPDDNVSTFEQKATRTFVATQPSKEELRGKPQRKRDDGSVESLFVAILMHGELRPRFVAIDQADIRDETRKAGLCCCLRGKFEKEWRHRRPRQA